ncbi:hypothetical protein [Streptomyces sp. N35]|nr:hypothetical protein [Streptomyces sp. N35]
MCSEYTELISAPVTEVFRLPDGQRHTIRRVQQAFVAAQLPGR